VFPVRYKLDFYILFRRNCMVQIFSVSEVTGYGLNDKVGTIVFSSCQDPLWDTPIQWVNGGLLPKR
jgi:hypothetical protein